MNMTDTSRATVTLDRSLMNLIDEIVGVLGATRPQVINNIVELLLLLYLRCWTPTRLFLY